MSSEKTVSLCQVVDCGSSATFHSFPCNAVHPDEWGMQTCDDHLSEGMSHLQGQPEPDHWRVFPIAPANDDGHHVTEVATC